jgi:hypothetical protein
MKLSKQPSSYLVQMDIIIVVIFLNFLLNTFDPAHK